MESSRILQLGNAELMARRAMLEIQKAKDAHQRGDQNSVVHHASNAKLYQIQAEKWLDGTR